jgi:hypothetical protein
MLNSDAQKPRWQELYEAVSKETDREKLTELVNGVEEALMLRAQELAHRTNHTETQRDGASLRKSPRHQD